MDRNIKQNWKFTGRRQILLTNLFQSYWVQHKMANIQKQKVSASTFFYCASDVNVT